MPALKMFAQRSTRSLPGESAQKSGRRASRCCGGNHWRRGSQMKTIAIAAAGALLACGGSAWKDPTTGNFSAQDSDDLLEMMKGSFTSVAPAQAPHQGAANKAETEVLRRTESCAAGGTVSVDGSIDS